MSYRKKTGGLCLTPHPKEKPPQSGAFLLGGIV